jgi:lipopolysaccharide/colanic/teichoic acid biosynthesis glycosyltransferase
VHLVVTPSAQQNRELTRRLELGLCGFEHVTLVPSVAALTPATAARHVLGSTWGISLRPPVDELPTRWVKRAVDCALGVPLFLASLPLIAALALCIKLVSPGPALFRQRRIGFGGREFDVFKLRSMYPDAEARLMRHLESDPAARDEWKTSFKLTRDPRLLPLIGTLLRRTSLDELPQLFNVLTGEMSLVGPRPLPRYHVDALPAEFCKFRERAVPGLTGLWQISERGNGEALVTLDLQYLRNWSLWLDLRILSATLWAVFTGRGAR